MDNKKSYRDYVGTVLEFEVQPFEFDSVRTALRKTLYKKIKAELTYSNGLICEFKDIAVTVDKKIMVKATITECQVDC